jgi:hypothetical protein
MCRPRWALLALLLLLAQPAVRVQAQESSEEIAELTPTLDGEADAVAALDNESPAEEANSDFDILKAAFDEKLADLADEHGSTHAAGISDAAQRAKTPDDNNDDDAALEEAAAETETDAELPPVNGNDSEDAGEQSEPATIDTLIASPDNELQSPVDETNDETNAESTDEPIDLEEDTTDAVDAAKNADKHADTDAKRAEKQQEKRADDAVTEPHDETDKEQPHDETLSEKPRTLSPAEYAQQLKDAEVKELRAVPPNVKAFAQRASSPFKRAAHKYNALLKDHYLALSFAQATVLGTAGDALAQAIEHATGRSGTRVGAATGVHVRPWLDVRRMIDVGFLTMLIDGLLTPRWYALLEKASISRSLPVVALKTALGSFVYGPFANGKHTHKSSSTIFTTYRALNLYFSPVYASLDEYLLLELRVYITVQSCSIAVLSMLV